MTETTKAQQLKGTMRQFPGGSDGRYRHMFNRRFIYTEGIKAMADTAGAHWLLDIIATEVAPKCLMAWGNSGTSTSMLYLDVKDGKAGIRLSLADDAPDAWKRHIEFTDFPEGEWVFELAIDGLIDDQDVLVMLLLEEH